MLQVWSKFNHAGNAVSLIYWGDTHWQRAAVWACDSHSRIPNWLYNRERHKTRPTQLERLPSFFTPAGLSMPQIASLLGMFFIVIPPFIDFHWFPLQQRSAKRPIPGTPSPLTRHRRLHRHLLFTEAQLCISETNACMLFIRCSASQASHISKPRMRLATFANLHLLFAVFLVSLLFCSGYPKLLDFRWFQASGVTQLWYSGDPVSVQAASSEIDSPTCSSPVVSMPREGAVMFCEIWIALNVESCWISRVAANEVPGSQGDSLLLLMESVRMKCSSFHFAGFAWSMCHRKELLANL